MKQETVYFLLIVFGTCAVILLLIKFAFKRLAKKMHTSRGDVPSYITTLKRTLVAFTWLVAIFLSSYAFFEKDMYESISANFRRTIWICLVVIFSVLANAVAMSFFDRRIKENTQEAGKDPTTYKFLKYVVSAFIFIFGAILIAYSIPSLRSIAQSALAGAGVIAVIIGVAAQEAFANLIGGAFIVIFKPFKVGDTIKVGNGQTGRVEDLTLRHTVINNFQNKRIVIPNSVVNKENIENYNLGERKICEWVEIGVGYDANIDLALKVMQEEAEAHPFFYDNRTENEKGHDEPPVPAKIIGFGDSSVNLRAWVWARNYPAGFNMRLDLYRSIKERFDQEGIEIPFPYRTLVFKQGEKERLKHELINTEA